MGVHLRRAHRIAAAATSALTVVVGFGIAQADPVQATGERVLPGSVAAAVSSGKVIGNAASTQDLTVQFWLQPNVPAAQAYANAVSDPHSPVFHDYLSPAQYTARFGPSTAATGTVSSWLRQQGFTSVTVAAQRDYVQASAPVATIQNALQVRMMTYQVAGSATPVTSNDRDVTLPTDIANDVSGISGLNSTPAAQDLDATKQTTTDNCSTYYGQNVQHGLPPLNGQTSVPTHICGYTGSQVRAAYGLNNASTGTDVSVAYVEWGLPYEMFQTLTKWAAANGLPAPKAANYHEVPLGSGNTCGNPFDTEEQLDIEAGYAMAPDQHQIVVGGDSCQTG
jgi:subtilase family serine protease